MLFQFSIPISLPQGVFHVPLFIEHGISPSKEEVLAVLEKFKVEDSKSKEFCGCWDDCIRTVELVDEREFPIICGLYHYVSCTIEHPTLGYQTFSVKRIDPYKI